MPQRTAKFMFAIFAGLLLGTPLVTASHGEPAKTEKCLSRPKGTPPAGGHWYYRTERATKRRCWFIGDAKEKHARRVAPETSAPAANSASPPESADTQPSIANARAELPLPRARVEPDTSVFAGQRMAARHHRYDRSGKRPARRRGRCRRPTIRRRFALAGAGGRVKYAGQSRTVHRQLRSHAAAKFHGLATSFQACAAGSRSRAPACRSGRIAERKAKRPGPDAADFHPWRTGACGCAGKRDFQAEWPAKEQHPRRRARELGVRSGPIVHRYRTRPGLTDRTRNPACCRGPVCPASCALRMVRTNGSRNCSRGRRDAPQPDAGLFLQLLLQAPHELGQTDAPPRLRRSALRIDCDLGERLIEIVIDDDVIILGEVAESRRGACPCGRG